MSPAVGSSANTVLVAGSSGGVGSAIVASLAGRWRVVGLDSQAPPDPSLLLAFYQADFLDTPQLRSVIHRIETEIESLWGMVYCAGVYPIVGFRDYDLDLWDRVHGVNVRAAFVLIQGLETHIVDGGRVVAISSGAAHLGSRDVGYAASKAGLQGLVKSLASNLAPRRIQVNAVAPGPVTTSMSDRMDPARQQAHRRQTAFGRFARPSEVAVAVDFLLDRDNSFITGATLDVNGGLYYR